VSRFVLTWISTKFFWLPAKFSIIGQGMFEASENRPMARGNDGISQGMSFAFHFVYMAQGNVKNCKQQYCSVKPLLQLPDGFL
jgi:hypothetical protein